MSSIARKSLSQSPFSTEGSALQTATATTTKAMSEDQNLEVSAHQSATHRTMATTATPATTIMKHKTTLHPLKRVYDPSKDNLPLEELLARPQPRLPPGRLPYENSAGIGSYFNGRTMKPLRRGAFMGPSDGNGGLEEEKKRMRAMAVEMDSLMLPERKINQDWKFGLCGLGR